MPDILISDSFKLLKLGKDGGVISSTVAVASCVVSSCPWFPSSRKDFPGGNPGRGFEAFLALPILIPSGPAVFALDKRKEALIAVGVADSLLSLCEAEVWLSELRGSSRLEVQSRASRGLR